VTKTMLKALWYLQQVNFLGYFYCQPSKDVFLRMRISFLPKLKAASNILETDAVKLRIISPMSIKARNYCIIGIIP